MNRDPRAWLPAGIAAFAIAIRILYLHGLLYPFPSQMVPIGPEAFDSRAFYDVGRLMAGLSVPESAHSRDPQWALAIWGPGYPIFLSCVFRVFGDAPWAVRHLQAILGGLTCLFVYALGERLGGRRAGAVAGLLAACYPTSILFTGRIATETLAALLLWSALYLLTRSARVSCHGLAGALLGLACLTRPTLLATLAFLPVATLVSARGAAVRRVLQALALTLVSGAAVVAWQQAASRFAERPTKPMAGVAGFALARQVAFRAADPDTRGWRREGNLTSTRTSRRRATRKLRPLPVLAVGALNLVFYHVWFLDNVWRELPQGAHVIQRLILVAALVGVGIALTRGRLWSHILALTLTLGLVSVKFIEIRPNLPFMPALFLLAGLFVSTLWDWIAKGATSLSRFALAAIFTAGAVGCTRLAVLGPLLPRADPLVLGQTGDAVAAATALLWAALLFVTARRTLARGPSLVIAGAPAFLFLTLFASYVHAASEPRWRSWPVSLKRLPVVQEIHLQKLTRLSCRAAYWLVDLGDASELALIRVALDGEWLPLHRTAWTRLFCSGSVFDRRSDPYALSRQQNLCAKYEAIASPPAGPLSSWPQWWEIPVEPERIRGRSVVSLALALAPGVEAQDVAVGATLSPRTAGAVYGPSPMAVTANAWTSMYRWEVADDWRIWEETPVRSFETRAGVLETGVAPGARRGPEASWLAADRLHLNVRLLVEEHSGRWVVY